jgi:hypothetical protein
MMRSKPTGMESGVCVHFVSWLFPGHFYSALAAAAVGAARRHLAILSRRRR